MASQDSFAAATALNSGAIHLLRAMAPIDDRSGLSAARLSALSVLVFGGDRSLGGLARIEGVTSATMTRIVDGMVELGLISRGDDPNDARTVRLSATRRGRSLMYAARRRRLDAIARAVDTLSTSDRRALSRAAGLLDQVARAVVVPEPSTRGKSGPRRRRVSARGSP